MVIRHYLHQTLERNLHMSAKFSAIVVGMCLALSSTTALLLPQVASAQQKDNKALNPKVGTPLQAALAATKNKQYDVALAKIKEADAEKKTQYEGFKINETLAFVYGSQKDYAKLASTYEKMLETPQFLGDQSAVNAKTIAQLYASLQQYPKVIEYSKRWLQDKPNDAEVISSLGQAYYSTKDYKACKDTMHSAIAGVEKGGGRPAENWLMFERSCSDSLGDSATAAQALEKLCRFYPKPDYWYSYIRSMSRGSSNLASFHWSRLMNEVGVLKVAEDYSNFAQQAMLEYGSPAEALRVVEEGYKKQILGAEPKTKVRHDILLTKAKEAAQADKARWPQMATEADQDSTGAKSAAMGMSYFGAEQWDLAIPYLEKALKKGGLKDPAHVKLTLGVAHLKKGQRDTARTEFKSVSSDPALGKVAAAWQVRSFN
jgi:tetratricopeptide (TPR) repeat protein